MNYILNYIINLDKPTKISIMTFIVLFLILLIDNQLNNKNNKIRCSYIFKMTFFISVYIWLILNYYLMNNLNNHNIDLEYPNF
jgi:hypothetical protein